VAHNDKTVRSTVKNKKVTDSKLTFIAQKQEITADYEQILVRGKQR
jgi:hypothetical protein